MKRRLRDISASHGGRTAWRGVLLYSKSRPPTRDLPCSARSPSVRSKVPSAERQFLISRAIIAQDCVRVDFTGKSLKECKSIIQLVYAITALRK